MDRDLGSGEDRHNIVLYQGQEYESYGLDDQGRHRLYNPNTKKFINISEN